MDPPHAERAERRVRHTRLMAAKGPVYLSRGYGVHSVSHEGKLFPVSFLLRYSSPALMLPQNAYHTVPRYT